MKINLFGICMAFFFCCLPFCLVAQNLPNVIPPSPQTQELNKYIDFPVDLSTGVPEISIPLYTIKTKGVEIPITLSYHASGIKSGQDDGDVGVGWSLSCNYRISRTIYGFADTKDIEMSPSSYQTNINSLTTLDLDKYLSRFNSDYQGSLNPDTHMPPRSGGVLDGEYDQFNYIVPGQGGKFIISNRINETVSEFSPTTNKFSYIEGTAANNLASGIIGFSMKDASQNVFSFGEEVDKLGAKVLETHNGSLNLRDVTAWALTDIDTKYGEKIKFAYTQKDISSKYSLQATLTVTEPRAGTSDVWEYSIDEESKSRNYSVFSLSSIGTPNERVNFVNLNPTGYAPKRIKQINVTDSLTSALIKRIEFYYSDIYIYPSGYTFLDSVKIFDKDLLTFEKYSFDYYDKDLPSSTVLVPDQWGYNKFESSRVKLLHQELGNDVGFPSGSGYNGNRIGTNTLYNNSGYGGYFSDRKSNNNPSIFSLKSISYPTGGKTLFEYEPNKISYDYSGGIRIKAIKKIVSLGQYNANDYELSRYYSYGLNDSGNGYSNYYLDHNDFRREQASYETVDGLPVYSPKKKTTYSSASLSEGNQITYYQHITERNNLTNGKTVYFFSAVPPTSVSGYPVNIISNEIFLEHYNFGPKYVSDYAEWQKPNLLKKEYFDTANNLLKKEAYAYLANPGTYFYGLKVLPFARFGGDIFNEYYVDYFSPALTLSSFYNHGLYLINTGKDLLTNKSEVTYSGNDSLKVSITYQYNSLDQVIKETTVDSKNQVIEKSSIYPADTPYEANASRMLQTNDVNKVLEETVTMNSDIVSQITNQYYELPGEIFVPDKILRYNSDTQLQEDGIVFHKYDAKGNVLSLSKANDVVINYIWSYASRFPIAEIKGTDYQIIENTLGLSTIQEFSSRVNPTKSEIDSFLAPIRTAINAGTLKDVEISSFSYDPVVGIKSQTDSRGKSTYYEYDSFGRLNVIKGDNGAIEKKMDYNYRNQ